MEGNFEVESGGWREIQTLAVENRTTVRSGEQGRGRREALKRKKKNLSYFIFVNTVADILSFSEYILHL